MYRQEFTGNTIIVKTETVLTLRRIKFSNNKRFQVSKTHR